tara:strand:+ start:2352 stop:3212 length:861 start_codon:yes stop_codon:yes gene_type:complete
MALADNALTTVADVKTYMGVTTSTDDTLIETLINNVSDQIERWCDKKLAATSLEEFIDARATRTLAVANSPIVSVDLVAFGARDAISVGSSDTTDLQATVGVDGSQARLHRVASDGTATTTNLSLATYKTTATLATAIDGTTGFTATVAHNAPSNTLHRMGGRDVLTTTAFLSVPDDAESDYRVDYERGFVHLRADAFPRSSEMPNFHRFPNQFQGVLVRYVGGYSTIPNALVQAAFELVSDAFRGRDRDRFVQQESVGDYSYTVRPVSEWSANVLQLLAPFRSIR